MQNKPGKTYNLTAADYEDAVYECIHSKHVRENADYLSSAESTFMFYNENDDTLNACAFALGEVERMYLGLNDDSVDWSKYTHGMLMYAGMLRWCTVLGNICEYFVRTESVRGTRKMLAWMNENAIDGKVGTDFVRRFNHAFRNDIEGIRIEQTRMYSRAVLRAVIAHELGHVCLGHCKGGINEPDSITRNDERTADLYSSTLAQSISDGIVGAVSAIMVMVSFSWLSGKKPVRFGDHPDAAERTRNYIESFNAVLVGSRITASMLGKLCR